MQQSTTGRGKTARSTVYTKSDNVRGGVELTKRLSCSMYGRSIVHTTSESGKSWTNFGRIASGQEKGIHTVGALVVCTPKPSCLRWFRALHSVGCFANLLDGGSNSPMRMAIIAITTSNSINVNPRRFPMRANTS